MVFTGLVSALVAVLGWWVVSYLRDKQAVKERQREVNVKYLINAHRVLSAWVHNNHLTNEQKVEIEGVIADVQLLGSNKMIDVLNQFLDNYNQGADPTNLLDILVVELRDELNLDRADSKRKFFRFL